MIRQSLLDITESRASAFAALDGASNRVAQTLMAVGSARANHVLTCIGSVAACQLDGCDRNALQIATRSAVRAVAEHEYRGIAMSVND